MNRNTIVASVVLMAVSASHLWASDLPAPMPEFQSKDQLALLDANRDVRPVQTKETITSQTHFYTGRLYDETQKAYIYKDRQYSPILARWTTEDPSGYPDGANNLLY